MMILKVLLLLICSTEYIEILTSFSAIKDFELHLKKYVYTLSFIFMPH